MSKRTFTVRAIWDEEAEVFYSESDIEGLHIEADTLDEFESIIMELAVELVVANHIQPDDLANKPLRDVVPAILWQRPDGSLAST